MLKAYSLDLVYSHFWAIEKFASRQEGMRLFSAFRLSGRTFCFCYSFAVATFVVFAVVLTFFCKSGRLFLLLNTKKLKKYDFKYFAQVKSIKVHIVIIKTFSYNIYCQLTNTALFSRRCNGKNKSVFRHTRVSVNKKTNAINRSNHCYLSCPEIRYLPAENQQTLAGDATNANLQL